MKKFISLVLFIVAAYASSNALAVTVTVQAVNPQASAATFALTAGQSYQFSVDPSDLWSYGPLQSGVWSNANGFTGASKLISEGLEAYYGTLVGQIGSDIPFIIGTNYLLSAAPAGTLKLFMWDDQIGYFNNLDNINVNITNVSAVPVPAAIWMLGTAMLGLVGYSKRKKM